MILMARDDNSQMLKGILQGCLLILLARKEQYGYAISESLNLFGFENVPKGTIYPLLMTMEKKGLLTSHMRPSPDGPSRKYYAITADAKKPGKHSSCSGMISKVTLIKSLRTNPGGISHEQAHGSYQ